LRMHCAKFNIDNNHYSKTLHLMEIGNHLVKGFVDISASMSIMSIVVIYELSIMHLVFGTESYKTTSSVVTQMLGKITELC
jgi:hypothetical protein